MGNALAVKEVEGVGDLAHNLGGLRLREVVVLLDAGEKLAAVDLRAKRLGL